MGTYIAILVGYTLGILTPLLKNRIKQLITNFFGEKGFLAKKINKM